jgi:hypothetical protein
MNARRDMVVLAVAAASVLGGAGCRAGTGTGSVIGELSILNCFDLRDAGAAGDPRELGPNRPYDMKPQFFAGEPIGDIRAGLKANRLLIRIQTTGRRREAVDVLLFDIPDSLAVARCVRARVINEGGTMVPDYDTANCWQGPNGARLRVAPDALVRAHFVPNETCNLQQWMAQSRVVVGTAIAAPAMTNDGNWQSWIELSDFGSAAQPAKPAEMRDPCCQPDPNDWKVLFDERIRSQAFQIVLEDDKVIKADKYNLAIPKPQIRGALAGQFDFDLARGQGAQTFP